jgi:hypothetical protein
VSSFDEKIVENCKWIRMGRQFIMRCLKVLFPALTGEEWEKYEKAQSE